MVTRNFVTKRYIEAIKTFQAELENMTIWLNADEDSIDGVEIEKLNEDESSPFAKEAIREFHHAMRVAKEISLPLKEMREALEDMQESIAKGYPHMKFQVVNEQRHAWLHVDIDGKSYRLGKIVDSEERGPDVRIKLDINKIDLKIYD